MNGSGALDPSGLQATVQAALGARCSVGIDFVDIEEVARSIETLGDVYLDRLFTAHERASCVGSPRSRAASFAARFAAKEAAVKVLAPTGPRPEWRSIEVVRLPHGACELHLHGTAAALADAAGLRGFSVSLTHEGGLAAAVVVGECPAPSIARLDVRDDHTGPRQNGGTQGPRPPRPVPSTRRPVMDQEIRQVLADHARLPIDVWSVGDHVDLFLQGLTSHASVNVMLALEEAFDIEFPEPMLRKSTFESIAAIRAALSDLLGVLAPS